MACMLMWVVGSKFFAVLVPWSNPWSDVFSSWSMVFWSNSNQFQFSFIYIANHNKGHPKEPNSARLCKITLKTQQYHLRVQFVSNLLVTLLGFFIHEKIGFNIFGVASWVFLLTAYLLFSIKTIIINDLKRII